MIKARNLDPSIRRIIEGMGVAGVSNIHYVATVDGNTHEFLDGKVESDKLHPTIGDAYVNVESGRNDTILLSPDSHSQAAALTFDKNMTHLVGMYPDAAMNHRARIGHSDDFDALVTVSGYGNLFSNIYTMHGRGSATNLHNVEVTGDRNTFKKCHFGGPMNATESGTAGYSTVELTGAKETLFEDCTLGVETIARSAANTVIRVGTDSSRNILKSCRVLSMSSATTPYYIEIGSSVTYGWTMFENCIFINNSSSWTSNLALGVKFGPATTAHRVFFKDCQMFNITDVTDHGKEAGVLFNAVVTSNSCTAGADAISIGLPKSPDHTS